MKKQGTLVIVASLMIAVLLSLNVSFYSQIIQMKAGTFMGVEIHCTMRHYRDDQLIGTSHHAGTLTTLGKNWIEDQLGDSPGADPAKWIGLSNSTDSPSAAWTVLPDEIITDGLARAAGTYANVGDGSWNITKTFSVTGTNSTQLVGLYYADSGSYLLCSDEITLTNVENGDSLEIEWTITVS